MLVDNVLNKFFDNLDKNEEILINIRQRKKIFDLTPKQKANISDLLDVKQKFQEIKKFVLNTFDDNKLSVIELDKIIDQFSVASKIINIILEEEDSYSKSVSTVDNFYRFLISTIHSWKYTVDIERTFLTDKYKSITKEGWVVSDDKFFESVKFLNENFILIDYDQIKIQNDFDEIIFNLVLILSFIGNDLVFNVAYVEQPFLVKKFFKYLNDYYKIGHIIKNLQKNTYYRDSITSILTGLESLKIKALQSKDGSISIKSWGAIRGELEDLIELFRDF